MSAQDGYLYADDKPNYIEEVYYMRWYRIEFFTEEFMTCVPSAENDYCVFSCERQYTSINRACAAANRMASTRPNVFLIRVSPIGGSEYRYKAK